MPGTVPHAGDFHALCVLFTYMISLNLNTEAEHSIENLIQGSVVILRANLSTLISVFGAVFSTSWHTIFP